MAKAQELFYAAVGAGDLAVDKVRSMKRFSDARTNKKLYKDVVSRGRTVSRKVRNSPAGKKVVAGTDTARRQVQDATKTVSKAFGVNIVAWPSTPTRRTSSGGTQKKTQTRKTTAKAS